MTDGVGFRPADFYSRSSSPCEKFTHHMASLGSLLTHCNMESLNKQFNSKLNIGTHSKKITGLFGNFSQIADPPLLVSCPSRGSLYWPLALCVDHLSLSRETGYSNVLPQPPPHLLGTPCSKNIGVDVVKILVCCRVMRMGDAKFVERHKSMSGGPR